MMSSQNKKVTGITLLVLMGLGLLWSFGNMWLLGAACLGLGVFLGSYVYMRNHGKGQIGLDHQIRQSAKEYDKKFDNYDPEGTEPHPIEEQDTGIWLDGDGEDWKRN